MCCHTDSRPETDIKPKTLFNMNANLTFLHAAALLYCCRATRILRSATLYLCFTPATVLEAGKPYIVKWTAAGANIVNPVFRGVTVTSSTQEIDNPYQYSYEDPATITVAAPTDVAFSGGKFCGTYDPTGIYSADHDKYYLGMDNKLYYPTDEGFRVNAFRAYFDLSGTSAVRSFVLNFGNDEASGIAQTETDASRYASTAEWFTLDGRKLKGRPTTSGLYIHQGRKVTIK